jgi:hypothetical protein
MKYIITESQYKKLETRQWLLRRYNLLMSEYKEAIEELDPCKFDTFEKYKKRVIVYIMDGLHHEYYLNDNFDYDGMEDTLADMFYSDITKIYHNKKERC